MWSVLASALAARRGQAVVIALLVMLATAAAAAAPWYAVAATYQVSVDAVAAAPVEDRLVSVGQRLATGEPHPTDPGATVRGVFHPDGFTTVVGGHTTAQLATNRLPRAPAAGAGPTGRGAEPSTEEITLAYREGGCAHLEVTGACPAAAGEVLVGHALAGTLDVTPGDQVQIVQGDEAGGPVTVVGTYRVVDPAGPYWGEGALVGLGPRGEGPDTVFTTIESLRAYERVNYTYELVVDPAAMAGTDPEALLALVDDGAARLRADGYAVTSRGIATVAERIEQQRQQVTRGVATAVATLLLATWFSLAVVVRGAGHQLRGDVGWWRLRGVPAAGTWFAALGQPLAPLLAGALLGTAAGLALGGAVGGGADDRLAWWLSTVLVAAALAGAVVTVVVTQLGTLRTEVRDLLRRVPARGPRWRRSLLDLLLVLLATVAVGQALLLGRQAGGLAALAPVLAMLAVALIAAWAVAPAAAWVAARALRAGHLPVALVAASMSRRHGTHRLVALVTVAVALVTAGFVGWDSAERAHWQRAALETGAARVIAVETADAAALLAAVRAVDPSGEVAMAVVRQPGSGTTPPVLAVDSTRLHLVTGWREQFGAAPEEVAAALRPSAAPALEVGVDLVVHAAAQEPAHLRVLLRAQDTGAPVEAVVGPVGPRPGPHRAVVPQCAGAGCRLVGIEVPGDQIALYGVAGAQLPDAAQWRSTLAAGEIGPMVSGGNGMLTVTAPAPQPGAELEPNPWLFIADAPAPLPVWSAGWRPDPTVEARLAPLPGSDVPVQLVASSPLLPALGSDGVVTDLEFATRLAPFHSGAGGTAEVWLAPDAPSGIVDDLRTAGVVPVRDQWLGAEVARLRSEGSAVGSRFQAVVALVVLALVTGTVLVTAAYERPARTAELAALRTQGLDTATVRAAGAGGVPAAITLAVVVGVGAGLVGAGLARTLHPGFVDGWSLLPPPAVHPWPVLAAAALAAVVMVPAALVGFLAGRHRCGTAPA